MKTKTYQWSKINGVLIIIIVIKILVIIIIIIYNNGISKNDESIRWYNKSTI